MPGVDVKGYVFKTFLLIGFLGHLSEASEIFSNARQYALGGAYSAMVQGAEAIFANPANLYDNFKWTAIFFWNRISSGNNDSIF